MEKVTVTFKDGTSFEAERNGTCLITDTKPDFPTDLDGVTISGDDGTETVENTRLIEAASVDGRYWFYLTEIPAGELKEQETAQRIADCEDMIADLIGGAE